MSSRRAFPIGARVEFSPSLHYDGIAPGARGRVVGSGTGVYRGITTIVRFDGGKVREVFRSDLKRVRERRRPWLQLALPFTRRTSTARSRANRHPEAVR